MRRLWLFSLTLLLFLPGCGEPEVEVTLPKEVEKRMEEQLHVDIVVPPAEKLAVKYAEIRYPPIVNQQQIAGPSVAVIVYTDEKGELLPLTDEQRAVMRNRQQRELFYGEYAGRPVIIMEIHTMKNFLADAQSQLIEGIAVEYGQKETDSGTYAFYSFNYDDTAYTTTFLLQNGMTTEAAVDFNRKLIRLLKGQGES
ncbi:hypothetical protein [Brevibacillus agri]|uniref:hypothetical protein n=1 Tax=Brevibacillus agri TaxID=51101 RepID=UPI00046EED6E|nr:hypothetical protein [Brevibacillus agri]MED4571196.1 hypothetical protein [Brevibacillus agri]